MKREFLLNLLFLLGINLLIKPLYIFGIDRGFQNGLGKEVYGIYAALLSFSYLLQTVNDFGIQNFNNRNISQHPQLVNKFFPNVMALKFGLSALYIIMTLSIGFILGFQGQQFQLLIWLAFNQVLVTMILYFRSNISGLQHYRWDSLLSSLDKLLMVGIGGYLLLVVAKQSPMRIEWLVYAQTVSYAITALVAIMILAPRLGTFSFRYRPAMLMMILKKSFPYALLIFLMSMYTRIDQVMIYRILPDGDAQAGIYAAAYRMLEASNMIGFLFAGLLLPMFAYLLGKRQSIASLVETAYSIILVMSIGLALYCFFFRSEIMDLLYVEADAFWAQVLGVLMFSFIAVGGSYVFGTLLTADGNLKALNVISFLGLIINVVLNFVLITKYKALGAAWATTVTQSFVFSCQIFWSFRKYELGIGWSFLFKVVFYVLTLLGTGWILQRTGVSFFSGTVIFMVAGVFSALAGGLLQWKNLKDMLVQKTAI